MVEDRTSAHEELVCYALVPGARGPSGGEGDRKENTGRSVNTIANVVYSIVAVFDLQEIAFGRISTIQDPADARAQANAHVIAGEQGPASIKPNARTRWRSNRLG
jgi:hypothetical protein